MVTEVRKSIRGMLARVWVQVRKAVKAVTDKMTEVYPSTPKLEKVFFENDPEDSEDVWKHCVNYQMK